MKDENLEEKKLVRSLKKLFGTVYFVQGTSSFSSLSMFYYMKEVLLLGPVGGQIFSGLGQIAWFIKPLWGFISDRIPIFGYRRKSWFGIMAITAMTSWFLMGLFAYLEIHSIVAFFMLYNFAMSGYAFVDVVTDALMVEHGKRLQKIGSFVTFQWTMLATSSLIMALSSGFLQEQIHQYRATGQGFIDYWLIFAITGIFPLLTMYMGIKHSNEKRDETQPTFSPKEIPGYFLKILKSLFLKLPNKALKILKPNQIKTFFSFLSEIKKQNKIFWILVLFIVFWNFSPSIGYVSQMYFVDSLDFTPIIFGSLRAVSAITWLLAILTYSWMIRRYKKMDWAKCLYAMIGMGFVGLICHYYYYLSPNHPLSFSITFPWNKILDNLSFLKNNWFTDPILKALENLSQWNRYHWWSLVTEITIGFASIPAFLIPLTICGQLTTSHSAGMTYAFLMSVSNATGSFGSLVGGLLYKLFSSENMSWFINLFQKSFLNISNAAPENTQLLILQIFIYVSAIFTLLTIPFLMLLKKEISEKGIKIYLGEQ
ncbi:MAG: MFS transporter [Patescibacteria group bacterium]